MKKVRLTRVELTDEGAFGVLTFGAHSIRSIELPWRDNRVRRSCIPAGEYRCALVNSPRFGRVYGVANVPGRTHVLIHAANLAGDVDMGWKTQLHGCIAPVQYFGRIKAGDRMQRAGLVSRPALRELMGWAGGEPFTLEISQ
jgi:hypothetical protein